MSGDAIPILAQPRANAPRPVTDKPYAARFESRSQAADGAQMLLEGALYRDNAGRLRVEYQTTGDEMTIIYDPVSGDLFFVDDARLTAYREPGGTGQPQSWGFADCIPDHTQEHKTIHDIYCRKLLLRDAVTRKAAGETWLSEELDIVMSDTAILDGAVCEWRVTEIELKEPEAHLFEVPSNYQVMAMDDQ